jgi:aspartate racemase
MGPDATVDFMNRVIALTAAREDQDHIRMLVDHNPQVPSRQETTPEADARIRRTLAEMAERLQAAGADFLVMVCNSAHAFDDQARRAVSIPFLSIVEETVRAIAARYPDARTAGVMATPSLIDAGLYQDTLAAAGLSALPVTGQTRDTLMGLIRQIKAGDQSREVADGMAAVAKVLIDGGADVIIAGCTEIPLVLDADVLPVPLVSSTEELARRTVELALGRPAAGTD